MPSPLLRRVAGIALVALAAVTAACERTPAPRGAMLAAQNVDQARLGPPAIPGVEGPFGVTQIDMPGQPWATGAPEVVTTAELMARRGPAVARDRTVPTGIRKIRPDRTGLADNPDARPVSQWPPSPFFRSGGPSAAFAAATPNVDIGFFADTGGSTPPDTMGDVGPTQYVLAMNGRVRAVSKATGAIDPVFDLDSDVFYGAAGNGAPTGDPRVRYDRRAGRWYILMFNIAVPNRYLLAVSSTSTITASTTWTIRFWANTRTQGGAGAVPCLGDYPTLGVDEDALYVGVNQFCGSSLNQLGFDSTSVYVLNRASVLGGGSATITQFDGVLPNGASAGPYTPQGVDNFDNGTNEGYFIGVDNAQFSTLVVRRVSNPAGVPTLSGNINLTVPTTTFPVDVPQPGAVPTLDSIDDRLMNAVVRNGTLWTVHQIGVNSSGVAATGAAARTAERWYQIGNLTGAPSLLQSGTVFDSATTNPTHHWMGSIMVNGQGHVALGASRGGGATFVNTEFTGRLAGATAGTMEVPTQYSSNTSTLFNLQGTAGQRWGDYSYTSVDPNDDMTMWTLQEYPNASNSYAVRLIRLLAPPPAAIASLSPSSVAAGQTGVSVTVTGTSSGGSGFYDPGAGFANRIAAAFSGSGVTVTNVVVNSPTSLTLTLNTVGAATGARTLTVTNPDGQQAALASALTITAAGTAPTAVNDAYSTPFNTPLVVIAPGVLANDNANGGGTMTANLLSGPASGSITFGTNGGFNFSPANGFSGVVTFTYTAQNAGGTSNVATVTITVNASPAPTSANDSYTTPFNTPLSVAAPGVLANDNANGGGTLTATPVTTTANGTLNLVSDGSFTFTPTAGFSGQTSFTYRAQTTFGGQGNTATVSITVNAAPAPTGVPDSYTAAFNTPLTVAAPGVLGNDSANGGGALTATLVSAPASGTLSLATSGGFTYTPASGFVGQASFTYRPVSANGGQGNTTTVTITVNAGQPSSVPDSYGTPYQTPLVVAAPGVLANDQANGGTGLSAQLVSGAAHGTVALNGNGSFTYTPNAAFSGPDTFTYRAVTTGGQGNTTTVTITVGQPAVTPPPTTNADSYSTPFGVPLVVAAPGVLGNDAANGGLGLTAVLVTNPANGAVTLAVDGSFTYTPNASFSGTDTFTYRAVSTGGPGNVATVTITVNAPAGPIAPLNFRIVRMQGNLVTFAWTPPSAGPATTGFMLEGGIAPGTTIGSLALPPTPSVTLSLPTGSFFLRLKTLAGALSSSASNEILAHINVPVTPSAPANLLGLVNGTAVQLAWTPTFGGGAPTGAVLDVVGPVSGSLPLGPSELFSFPAMPNGTFTFSVRQTNAGGSSPASAPVTLTFPGPCTGAPQAPANFLAYKSGGQLYLLWDPPAAGVAPSAYTLNVSGSFSGAVPMGSARSLTVPVGGGSYTFSVTASNACGSSAPTAAQTVSFP